MAKWLEENCHGLIVCGHYHAPGQTGRVINVGALVQHNFGDEGSERGFWVLEDSTGGAKSNFLRSTHPEFVTWNGKTRPDPKGNFVRVKARNLKEADKQRQKATDLGALSVVVEIEKEFKTAHEKTIELSTPRKMLIDYLEIVDKHDHRKEAIIDLFDRVCL